MHHVYLKGSEHSLEQKSIFCTSSSAPIGPHHVLTPPFECIRYALDPVYSSRAAKLWRPALEWCEWQLAAKCGWTLGSAGVRPTPGLYHLHHLTSTTLAVCIRNCRVPPQVMMHGPQQAASCRSNELLQGVLRSTTPMVQEFN